MVETVTLSDDKPCDVLVLGLFDLEYLVPEDPPGEFLEMVDIGGKLVGKRYVPPEIPPEEPQVPRSQARPDSQLWHDWAEWDLWLGYLDHRRQEARVISDFANGVKRHILEKCIQPEDVGRIKDKGDWAKIHGAATSAGLREEDLALALASTFQS